LIAARPADAPCRQTREEAFTVVTPISARPACLPGSVAFCAARLPAPQAAGRIPSAARMGDLHALLPPDLQPAVAKRRMEFLAGRLCAREAARRLGRPLPLVHRGPNGEPVWPAGLVGSIAHSNSIACAVVADASSHRAIGVDVEQPCSAEDAEQLAPMVFASGERSAIGEWPEGEGDLFTTVFSLKEAIYKSLYPIVRRFVDFQEIRLVRTGPAAFAPEVSDPLKAELDDWRFNLAIDRLAGHRFALSVAAPPGGAADGV
jgi:enterobactin synthetase component D